MRIRIIAADRTLTAVLDDNETARDFASLLPLTLTLEDFNRTEKIADLPRKLSTAGAPPGADPKVGDIAYYAPWGNLALFYRDFSYSRDLVRLGRLEGDPQGLAELGAAPARVEIITED
ncbi:cyclophilin-like fold protein [Brevundimonas intermedia]|nr:cyclophilin-like fold protein [Brevundimonas intermedia]